MEALLWGIGRHRGAAHEAGWSCQCCRHVSHAIFHLTCTVFFELRWREAASASAFSLVGSHLVVHRMVDDCGVVRAGRRHAGSATS
jgi:hypothetical protein